MIQKSSVVIALAAVAFAGCASAQQPQPPALVAPTPEILARADRFDPPTLKDLAAKLASQPDMTGTWSFFQPPGTCTGPLFDPPNSTCPPRPTEGEAVFGPAAGTRLTAIPYTPEYQAMYDKHIEEAKQGFARDTFAACIPFGVPRMVGESPTPFDIVQAPDIMFWHNAYARTQRRIFLDGRQHPAQTEDGPGPSYSGHSVGRWEGKTLVIDTVDMINAFFDETAAPHSDKLKMVERLRLIDTNLIENEITLTDPVAFTRPWVVKRYYQRAGEAGKPIVRRYQDLSDRPCVPNVKMDENGFQVIMLPQEIEEAAARATGHGVPAGE